MQSLHPLRNNDVALDAYGVGRILIGLFCRILLFTEVAVCTLMFDAQR